MWRWLIGYLAAFVVLGLIAAQAMAGITGS
jgi:hypothetical protein